MIPYIRARARQSLPYNVYQLRTTLDYLSWDIQRSHETSFSLVRAFSHSRREALYLEAYSYMMQYDEDMTTEECTRWRYSLGLLGHSLAPLEVEAPPDGHPVRVAAWWISVRARFNSLALQLHTKRETVETVPVEEETAPMGCKMQDKQEEEPEASQEEEQPRRSARLRERHRIEA